MALEEVPLPRPLQEEGMGVSRPLQEEDMVRLQEEEVVMGFPRPLQEEEGMVRQQQRVLRHHRPCSQSRPLRRTPLYFKSRRIRFTS